MFSVGDTVVKIVGMAGYEKGFCYKVARIIPLLPGELSSFDTVYLENSMSRYDQCGCSKEPYDSSFLVLVKDVPPSLRIFPGAH